MENDVTKDSYHHGDLKTELIEKGLKILDEEGYDSFSMRKVAKACGVSQTAPYRHFKDKNDLIAAITMTALQVFNQSLEQAFVGGGDPKRQLKDMGIYYIRFFKENPEYLRILFLSKTMQAMGKGGHNESHRQDGHPFSAFVKAVKNYKMAYPEDHRSEEELVIYCWGLVHGIAVLIVNNQLPCDGDAMKLVQRMFDSERFL